jgi:hypothetical protein
MALEFYYGNIRANCPTCGEAVTTYEFKSQSTEYGTVVAQLNPSVQLYYKLLRCAGCGRGGMAEVQVSPQTGYTNGSLLRFFPPVIQSLSVPPGVPSGIQSEFVEAELCASVQAWRAASALLRSTLEKTLIANGYTKGSLAARIDEAAADGVITAARSKRAHDDIRVLGNDVLHDEWRAVTEAEFDLAHRYAQRILEDLYDDRPSVEALLKAKSRLP